ncbi:MAG: hypothetical protein ACLU9S_04500 [Oscillospiraceae bacterium]
MMVIVPPYPVVIASAGSLGDDRSAVDGDAAAITQWHVPIPTLSTARGSAFRQGKGFGTDNAAIDGDAAALPEIAGRHLRRRKRCDLHHVSADGGGALACPLARILPPLMMIVPSLS